MGCCRRLICGLVLCVVAALSTSNRLFRLGSPYPIKCDQPLPRKCAKMDTTPHCLTGRQKPVFGHCEFQTAICDQKAHYDPSESCDLH